MRTLLKWPGNKRRVMEQIRPHLDWDGVQRWVEPFAGALGATVSAQIPEGVEIRLSDGDPLLGHLYRRFLEDPEGLQDDANSYEATPHDFYRIRSAVPTVPRWRAAWMLYMNKRSFNGLIRFNRQGQCTSAWGQSARPIRLEGLEHVSDLLRRSGGVGTSDWRGPVEECGRGDLLFLDPPYIVPDSPQKEWAGYGVGFGWSEQVDLEAAARRAWERGAVVVACNSWCPAALGLWAEWEQRGLERTTHFRKDRGAGRAFELLCLSR